MRFPVSKFQRELEAELLSMVEGRPKEILQNLIEHPEINHLQEYANIVSINRLGYNDHGPVHARMVTRNVITVMNLIKGKIETSLEKEKLGTFEDSLTVLLIAAFTHDLGMTMGRNNHERNSVVLGGEIIESILKKYYKDDNFAIILKALTFECILGHMGHFEVTSIEAGVLLVSDGCDMSKGRARIPFILQKEPTIGDIHKYSAMSINKVTLAQGEQTHPVKITVDMEDKAGIFQIEEVLMGKVKASSIKDYIQILVTLKDGTELIYK